MGKIRMAIVKLDPSKLLGFRLDADDATLSVKAGAKLGNKAGVKQGNKVAS
jgi:hypothetical protein